MKKSVLILTALLGACSAPPPKKEIVFAPPPTAQPNQFVSNIPNVAYLYEPQVSEMSRLQVIEATRMCEDANLRAFPVMAKRRITGQTSDVIVDIQCLPRYR
jgi:hypothetical protein